MYTLVFYEAIVNKVFHLSLLVGTTVVPFNVDVSALVIIRGIVVALLLLSYRCNVTINGLWLFHMVSWVGLQCVIVVLHDHNHLLF